MSDSRHPTASPGIIYTQHPTGIHLGHHRADVRDSAPQQLSPAFCSSSGRLHAQSPRPTCEQPAALLLHPLVQLVPFNNLQPITPPHSLSTAIVSHHSQSPTTERDPTRAAAKNNLASSLQARRELDGNSSTQSGVYSGVPPMTLNGVPTTMGGRREDVGAFPRSQRPSIVSHHSNSVPSTPFQAPRQFESRSRSPSPNGGLGSHSPRSVSSEANGIMPSLRKGQQRGENKCPYETNAAFGRRRMPYTESSDPLDKAKEEPKKALQPHEEEKLSGDMRELYDRLLPSPESSERRTVFVKKLEGILHSEWPGNEFKVHVFGSSGNLLYTSESDVDVCIQTSMKKLEEMHMLAEALAKHGMEKVVCIPQAKVKIVKVWDPVLRLACDMNVNNTLALENTRMIKTYVQLDDRIRPLAMIIKHWTKRRILNDAALGGTISSYTWICMILNFLQTRDPPILPSLHQLSPTGSDFADDVEQLRGFGDSNKETLGELLFYFFRRYGHEIDYEQSVVSVRQGKLITRAEKKWDLASLTKEGRNRLCVEEPFNTERNLGNSADEFAWRGIHLEIRRAFDLLADGGKLNEACEQFEFPPEEKVTFKKPAQNARPVVLSHSASSLRAARGGPAQRGGRNSFGQKGSHSYQRRASSSASYGNNRPPFLNSPPIPATNGQEYFGSPGVPRGLNEQLHDQLFQQYQLLEAQSNSLRAQLAAQQRAQQAHQVQAAIHAQAVAQAQAQAHNRGSSTNGSPQKSPYINGGRSSPRLGELNIPPHGYPQFLHYYPTVYDMPQGVSQAQDGSRTNPSSPSLTNSVPGLRRTVHRSSNASETSIRSQSQPARGLPPQGFVPGQPPIPPQFVEPSSFAGYPIARSTQEPPSSQPVVEPPYSPPAAYVEPMMPPDHSTPKEYVGYYVEPQARPRLQDYAVEKIPPFSELARRRRVSPEVTQPLLNTALRRVSRSPSPLGGHVRSYSTSVATPVPTTSQQRKDRIDSIRPVEDAGGLVIANGSYPASTRDNKPRRETVDLTPNVDLTNPSALGIYVNNVDQYPNGLSETRQPPAFLEEMQRQQAIDMARATANNGTVKGVPHADANGLLGHSNGGKKSFPPLPESWNTFDAKNGTRPEQVTEISPTQMQPHWQMPLLTNGLKALDTLNAPRAPPQEIKSATLPLLSPVFETTRTPSPTATRQAESGKPVNGVKQHAKENQQARRASHASGQTTTVKEHSRGNQQKGNGQTQDKNGKSSVGTGNSSPQHWQQQNTKRRRKPNKQSGPHKQGNEAKTTGEPLPANAADRKGG